MIQLTTLQWILLMTLLNGLLAFAGAILYIILRKNLNKILIFLVAFTTGALLGGAFFHFIPEAVKELNILKTVTIIFLGMIVFYLIEKILHWHHCHDGVCKKHPFTFLILYGDAIHNFVDGLIIAGSFLVSTHLGIITSLLILAHELPQEIGDFGVLVYGGLSKKNALIYNFLSQLTAIVGGILGFYFLSFFGELSIYLLAFAAGSFLYIAIMDLAPELLKEKNPVKIVINLIAIVVGLLILLSTKLLVG